MDTTSMIAWPWSVLLVDENADERTVRRAYARALKQQRPEDDPGAFQRLREAYEAALSIATRSAQAVTTVRSPAPVALEREAEPLVHAASEDAEPANPVHDQHVALPTAAHTASDFAASEPDPVETASQWWGAFLSDPTRNTSRRSLKELFDSVVNFRLRDELEWQALCHCLRDDTSPAMRINICQVLDWRDNSRHLVQRDAATASQALARAFADEDYESLRAQFPYALHLLDGTTDSRARAMLDPDYRKQMEGLLFALRHYYPNVLRFRIEAAKLDFWTRAQSLRVRLTDVVIPSILQSAWAGWLVASASSMHADGIRYVGNWGPLQITLAFVTTMIQLLAVLTVANAEPPVRARIDALRALPFVRYGWALVWLAAMSAAMATGATDSAASLAAATLAVCTLWATAVHGLLPTPTLLTLPFFASVGLGLIGHCLRVDHTLWVLAVAHGLLLTYFYFFLGGSLRARLVKRVSVVRLLAVLWLLGAATCILLMASTDWRSTQYAWGLFIVLSVGAPSFLNGNTWRDVRRAIPLPFRGALVWVWFFVALVRPDMTAGLIAALMSIWVIGDLRQIQREARNRIR